MLVVVACVGSIAATTSRSQAVHTKEPTRSSMQVLRLHARVEESGHGHWSWYGVAVDVIYLFILIWKI